MLRSILCLAMLLTLGGCGGSAGDPEDGENDGSVPGEGDSNGTGAADGCFGTATLRCGVPLSADAGATVWICTR